MYFEHENERTKPMEGVTMTTQKRASMLLGSLLLQLSVLAGFVVNSRIEAATSDPRVYVGAWANTVSCSPSAVVTYSGAAYICLISNKGVAPNTSANDWKDAQGASGPQGSGRSRRLSATVYMFLPPNGGRLHK
jgi:hypothetical protein